MLGADAKKKESYGVGYFVKGAFAGGVCCSVTHSAVVPLDVCKTLLQLQPERFAGKGLIGVGKQVVAEEGIGGLSTGLGPTAVGYFVQGWFKFGGVEFFKIKISAAIGDEAAWNNRTLIYLGAAAGAEFIADIFLTPLEATRIRLVQDPKFASGLGDAAPKILKQDGFMKGFYSGFAPILFKQVPYTMAKFAVQGKAEEFICRANGIDLKKAGEGTKMGVALSSGVIAGVAAAIISHPADTLLSLINKSPTAGGTGSTASRLANLAKEVGVKKLCLTGLGARCIMIGTLTAGQFAIFDTVLGVTGAKKFHFTDPNAAKKN